MTTAYFRQEGSGRITHGLFAAGIQRETEKAKDILNGDSLLSSPQAPE